MAKRLFLRQWSGPAVAAAAVATLLTATATAGRQVSFPADRETIAHVLGRVTFGVRPGDVDRVARIGLDQYLRDQLRPNAVDDSALDARLATFETLTLSTAELADKYFQPAEAARRLQQAQAARTAESDRPVSDDGMMAPGASPAPATTPNRRVVSPETQQAIAAQRVVISELMQAKLMRAAMSERQLQEVLTDFWFNHFNVFIGKGQVRQYLTEYERDVIRPNVFGSFRDLLGKVAHSPAMLFYLDNWQSSSPNPQVVVSPEVERRLNDPRLTPEQRQRLTMRLQQMRAQMPRQNRGLNENYARELMELHTLGVDGGYTQQDVVELARILTGWTIDQPRNGGQFIFRPGMHDGGTKTLLGQTFAAAGQAEGEKALDLLASHPSTARHIAFKLAQRFIADEPPAALVDRVAKVFRETRGNLREVTATLLTSPEFLGKEYRRAMVKTPLEYTVSAVRATGAAISNAQPLVTALQNLGMPLYGAQPPTGYSTTADAWVNTGALLARMNFAVEMVSTGRVQPQQTNGRAAGAGPASRLPAGGRGRGFARPLQVDVAALAPDVTPRSQTAVVTSLLNGVASDATRQTLARATSPEQLLALALGAPEFQRK